MSAPKPPPPPSNALEELLPNHSDLDILVGIGMVAGLDGKTIRMPMARMMAPLGTALVAFAWPKRLTLTTAATPTGKIFLIIDPDSPEDGAFLALDWTNGCEAARDLYAKLGVFYIEVWTERVKHTGLVDNKGRVRKVGTHPVTRGDYEAARTELPPLTGDVGVT